jgi:hypothetical protein
MAVGALLTILGNQAGLSDPRCRFAALSDRGPNVQPRMDYAQSMQDRKSQLNNDRTKL